ncbi:MAG: alpha-hydroxy-acid oxidizing protein [Chelatococcus sp.]|jgi:L-lactate dehydrogenase (cytochrome)|uniref:alpha-hydroxy acid oxidase n=1 Tax=Chelatococcus sp. TaxID=1953771 RepID=UPI0025BF6FC0|nr:alpha-hydroxy acid oxidase [Chelatococcus sp.]MBX3540483.1 alpha-hydroxy-acid oxidizing protein [Chelatococcus sp.]
MLRRTAASVHDYRLTAQSILPRTLFEYVDGGALDESTLARNTADFEEIYIRQKVLRGEKVDPAGPVLGHIASFPVALAPIGSLGMLYPQGEILAFQAAHAAGIGACLSSFSVCSIEEVMPEVGDGDAFQLYVLKDPGRTEEILARATAAGFRNLVITVDTTHPGMRDRDLRNGYRSAARPSLSMLLDCAMHPRWFARSWRSLGRGLGNFAHWDGVGSGLIAQAAYMSRQLKTDLTWSDIEAVVKRWPGRVVVKGVTDPEDVARAIGIGADGVVVSNHGGRQLDGVMSSIAALPVIASRYSGEVEILFDSGIRRGSHLLKALALGADGCLLGRSYAYGLAAAGADGVIAVLEMLRKELTMSMSLAGVTSVEDIKKRHMACVSLREARPNVSALVGFS